MKRRFGCFLKLYSRRLFHLAYYYLDSRELAEEAVLDVFTVVWQKRETLAHVKEPGHYLYVAVKNQALHYIRRGYVQEKEPYSLYEIELVSGFGLPRKGSYWMKNIGFWSSRRSIRCLRNARRCFVLSCPTS